MTIPTVPGYDLLDRLGSGGSGQVWRARRRVDGLPVAVKLVRPGAGDADALTGVLAEAGLLAGLRHEHVLHLYDVLPLGDPGDPVVAVVTQLAAGGSLAQVLHRRRLLSPGELVTVLHPISRALGDLHRAGVVHGDVSPGNLLFRSDGMPLLGDLGTARVAGEQGLAGWGTDAHDGMVAPEVLEGFPAAAESDVYQLGAVAWLCLVGERPGPGFDRPTLTEVSPALPPALVELVQGCMAPQPEDRPAADDLPAALLELVDPEPVEVAPDADPATGLTQRLRQVALADGSGEDRPRRRPPWWRRRPGGERRPGVAATSGAGGARPHGRSRPGGAHRPDDAAAQVGPARLRALVVMVLLVLLAGVGTVLLLPDRSAPSGAAGAPPATSSGMLPPDVPPPTQPAAPSASPAPWPASPGAPGSPRPPSPPSSAAAGSADGDPGARPSDTLAVVQGLLDRRAAAWEQGDPERLGEVTVPGSGAEAQERSLLRAAAVQGLRYPAVDFEVSGVAVAGRTAERLVVDATVLRAPLEVWRGEELVHAAPGTEERVRLELAAHEGGWRVRSWELLSPEVGAPPTGPPAPRPGA